MRDLKEKILNSKPVEFRLSKEQKLEIFETAKEKLCEKFGKNNIEFTGVVNDDNEIYGEEVIINVCNNDFVDFKLGGWLEIDLRTKEPQIWLSTIILMDFEDREKIKIGGGYGDNYMIIRCDYDYKKKEWGKCYKDSL